MNPTANYPFNVKAAEDDGVFEGYASVFDIMDDGRDSIAPGAFARSLAQKGASAIRLLWQHNPAEPIGVIDHIAEDARGLFVKGRLLLEVQRAREALALMRCGALDGLSIGYRTLRARHDSRSGTRRLEDVDLWEVSLVTFPMQHSARIGAFKAARPETLRDFEGFLREAGGFSRREAKAVAAHGFDARSRRDAGADWTPVIRSIDTLIANMKESSHEHRNDTSGNQGRGGETRPDL